MEKENIIEYEDMTTRHWLEIIDDLLVKGIESQKGGIDYYLEKLADDRLIIRFDDEKESKFIIQKLED